MFYFKQKQPNKDNNSYKKSNFPPAPEPKEVVTSSKFRQPKNHQNYKGYTASSQNNQKVNLTSNLLRL